MMQRAEADLFVSKILLDIFKQPCAEIDLAAYHLQQALEKLMNYKLISISNKYEKTHDLLRIRNELGKNNIKIPKFINLQLLRDLKSFESLGRYNNTYITDISKLYEYYSRIERYLIILKQESK